jgi:uncharacterized protein (TIGR00661 family)
MGRILYAVQGEGLGHATRAHSVGAGLIERGHEVRFVSSRLATPYLREHFPDRVEDIFGFRLVFTDGRIRFGKTVARNTYEGVRDVWPTLRAVRRIFHEFQPDLLITDAEEFTPAVARFLGVPFVSVDNQHLLTHCDVDRPPGFALDYVNAYLVIRLFHAGARRYLISTFIDAPIRHQPATLVPPVLRKEVYKQAVRHGDYLVAYLGGSGEYDRMRRALELSSRMPIRAYGFGIEGEHGRVTYKATSANGFLKDLAGCAGVVASAGHSLVSESLYLDKPMLLVPIAGQFEQLLNAHYVERMGAGRAVANLTPQDIAEFADKLDTYRAAITDRPKASLAPVLDAIERELPNRIKNIE